MRELLLERVEAEDEAGSSHGYDYFIVVDEMDVGRFCCESYGVNVRNRASGEVAVAPNITVSAERIDQLMELLVRNAVSPTNLLDVVADWL